MNHNSCLHSFELVLFQQLKLSSSKHVALLRTMQKQNFREYQASSVLLLSIMASSLLKIFYMLELPFPPNNQRSLDPFNHTTNFQISNLQITLLLLNSLGQIWSSEKKQIVSVIFSHFRTNFLQVPSKSQ